MEDYGAIASQILALVGGRSNVGKATHCLTRLRLVLRDESRLKKDDLLALAPVRGVFVSSGVVHVVVGPGVVESLYTAFLDRAGIDAASPAEFKAAAAEKLHPLQRLIRIFSDVFQPVLPAIIVSGLLLGVNNLLSAPGLFIEEQSLLDIHPQLAGVWALINLMANTAFVFLPALVGWSAARRFGGSEVLGIVLGLLLVHPDLLNGWNYGPAAAGLGGAAVPHFDLGWLRIERVGYQGQILPILAAAYVMSRIERWLKPRVADALQLLVVPIVTIVVSGFLALAVIGPITRFLGAEIVSGLMWVYGAVPLLGAALFGALYAPLVITGMHHMLIAIDLQLIAGTGGTFVWPMIALSNIAQGAAALAMFWASGSAKERSMASTAALSAFFGITEPAMFGVNLRHKFPFYAALAGSAAAAVFVTLNQVTALGIGVGGLPGFISIRSQGILAFLVGTAIALVVPFTAALVVGRGRPQRRATSAN